MIKEINIPPIPIIVCRDKLCEDDLDHLSLFYNRNKAAIKPRIKYPLDEMNFTTQIGQTEYVVNTNFDISGKQTILEQFKNLILSQN